MQNLYNKIKLLLPSKKEVRMAILSFSKREKVMFFGLFILLIITTLTLIQSINRKFMVEVPMRGGSISEGIVGAPRFINPVLAISDADRDLTSLIYSGLTRKSPDGSIIPDLAESYDVSKDGLTYTFILKDKISFQNGTPVTADDVIFTINEAKDPIIKSPRKGNWDGVDVTKVDDKTIVFTLKQPYASFLENATIGILPATLWKNSAIELNDYNINPIGSGPYQISNVNKKSSGTINYYDLIPFKKFALGKPYIDSISLHFYPSEDDLIIALRKGEVTQMSSLTPENALMLQDENYDIKTSVLPRVFGLFFNQNQAPIFTDKNIIKAIDLAVNKDEIIKQVLKGYGTAIDSPIPPNMVAYQTLSTNIKTSHEENLQKAIDLLAKDGWAKNADGVLERKAVAKKAVAKKSSTTKKTSTKTTTTTQAANTVNTNAKNIEFTIYTGNAVELAETANVIANELNDLGMKVDVKTFEIGNLNQTVIRPRKYDVLLFGEIITHESDLYAFWHSSQRNDPGLNVAIYTNPKVDKILEDALVTVDEKSRIQKYMQFEDQISKDTPAVFLYSPDFIYVVSKNLNGLAIDHITSPGDRFLNIYNWSVAKDYIWKIFSK